MNELRLSLLEKAQIDQLPVYRRKTALQRSVQLLKRHRDVMFQDDPDLKPISIIITTLAAKAYAGETDLVSAMAGILERMDMYVSPTIPRVPNPVDPAEDFADRWSMPKYKHLKLEENFRAWLRQVRTDFNIITRSDDAGFISEQAKQKFKLNMDATDIRKSLGLEYSVTIVAPKSHSIDPEPPRPWAQD
jgi:hypothetical protein